MRGLSLGALLVLAGCNPGITPTQNAQNEAVSPNNAPAPPPQPPDNTAVETNVPEAAPEPGATPGLAGMSPYRRREYERGYRDCMTGNFDGEQATADNATAMSATGLPIDMRKLYSFYVRNAVF